MCGICGKVVKDAGRPLPSELAAAMCRKLAHRGPDDGGTYAGKGVVLGHRRLAVIDLSPEAAQPLFNEDGTLVLVMNGEIYNHVELRNELKTHGHRFRTRSDSEVLLHLYEEHGRECLVRMEGMFAFALWDAGKRVLFAARDRLGQKPFYFAFREGDLTFASEIEALLEDRTVPREVNRRAVFDYLSLGYVPPPHTGFVHVQALPPAHSLTWRDGRVEIRPFWKPSYRTLDFIGAEEEVEEKLREHVHRSVALRLQADVEVGIFLSGGMDSSVVAAEASCERDGRIKAFSVSFPDRRYDETGYAAETARFLGLEHVILPVSPNVPEILPVLARRYGDLFGDSSCIPTYCISQAAAAHVKVALSGDGGDELFGGYNRYRAFKYQTLLKLVPRFLLRPLLSGGARLERGAPRGSRRENLGRFCRVLLERGHRYAAWVVILSDEEKRRLMNPDFLAAVPDREIPTESYPHAQDGGERRGGSGGKGDGAGPRDIPSGRPSPEGGQGVDGARAGGPLSLLGYFPRGVRRFPPGPLQDKRRGAQVHTQAGIPAHAASPDPQEEEDGIRRASPALSARGPRRSCGRPAGKRTGVRPGGDQARSGGRRGRGSLFPGPACFVRLLPPYVRALARCLFPGLKRNRWKRRTAPAWRSWS